MALAKTTVLEDHWHVVTANWDGFAKRRDETDGGKVLGIADLIPDGSDGRRGRWRITVEFEEG